MKKIHLLAALAFLLTININSRAQIITTYAGTGVPAYGGDGGSPATAKLNYPSGLVIDGAGVIYIADRNNHCVRKITGGIITTIAGSGGTSGYSGDSGPA